MPVRLTLHVRRRPIALSLPGQGVPRVEGMVHPGASHVHGRPRIHLHMRRGPLLSHQNARVRGDDENSKSMQNASTFTRLCFCRGGRSYPTARPLASQPVVPVLQPYAHRSPSLSTPPPGLAARGRDVRREGKARYRPVATRYSVLLASQSSAFFSANRKAFRFTRDRQSGFRAAKRTDRESGCALTGSLGFVQRSALTA